MYDRDGLAGVAPSARYRFHGLGVLSSAPVENSTRLGNCLGILGLALGLGVPAAQGLGHKFTGVGLVTPLFPAIRDRRTYTVLSSNGEPKTWSMQGLYALNPQDRGFLLDQHREMARWFEMEC